MLRFFQKFAVAAPDRPAIWVEGQSVSYGDLYHSALGVAAGLVAAGVTAGDRVVLFGMRTLDAYVGVLGALAAGCCYVPTSTKFPAGRNVLIAKHSRAKFGVLAAAQIDQYADVLAALSPMTLVVTDGGACEDLCARYSQHTFVSPAAPLARAIDPPSLKALAYLLFTSGTTGDPKGVGVTHANAEAYLEHMIAHCRASASARFTQLFDFTFDLSIHDMFVCWGSGACLCVPDDRSVLAPAKFVREQHLTHWFSVPSVAAVMKRLRMLPQGAYPELERVQFCGEALPMELAAAFAQAAPNAVVENLYGPTEATIAITSHRWHPHTSPAQCRNGLVPIGTPYPGQKAFLVDENMQPVVEGKTGELLLSGSQLAPGYLDNPDLTVERFIDVEVDGEKRVCYRTGDTALFNRDAGLQFIGRTDLQVKISGYRVELAEIELVLREVSGAPLACAIPIPIGDPSARGVVGIVIASGESDVRAMQERCRHALPWYMVPERIIAMPELPLNANGKVDRNRLQSLVGEGQI